MRTLTEAQAQEAVEVDVRVGTAALVMSDIFGGRAERVISAAVEVVAALDRLPDSQFDAFRGGFEAVCDDDVDEAAVRKSYEEWMSR